VCDTLLDVGRHAVRPAASRRFMDPIRQRLDGRSARFQNFVGVFVAQLI
jgi:hypothetical protein